MAVPAFRLTCRVLCTVPSDVCGAFVDLDVPLDVCKLIDTWMLRAHVIHAP